MGLSDQPRLWDYLVTRTAFTHKPTRTVPLQRVLLIAVLKHGSAVPLYCTKLATAETKPICGAITSSTLPVHATHQVPLNVHCPTPVPMHAWCSTVLEDKTLCKAQAKPLCGAYGIKYKAYTHNPASTVPLQGIVVKPLLMHTSCQTVLLERQDLCQIRSKPHLWGTQPMLTTQPVLLQCILLSPVPVHASVLVQG